MVYEYFIVRTKKAGSSTKIRVSPIEGQGLPTTTMVECSKSMRTEHPVGTLFKLKAKKQIRKVVSSHYNKVQYQQHIETYKFYMDITVKLVGFYFAVSGAMLSFYHILILRMQSLLLYICLFLNWSTIISHNS